MRKGRVSTKAGREPAHAEQAVRPRLIDRAWPLAMLTALAGLAFLRLLSSGSDQIIAADDIEKYFHWLHQFAREELLGGRIPLWNPYSFAGTPFAANPQTALFYPATLLYLAMPVIQAHKWMIAIHCSLAGGFMYLFLRGARLNRTAALAGCLPWMLGGYFTANAAVGHLTLLFSMTWLPLVLYCYDRALESRRLAWGLAAGFVLGLQVLAGEPQVCYYSALLMVVYGLVRTTFQAGPPGKSRWDLRRYARWAGGLVLIAVTCVLTSGIQLLPTAEFALHSDRSTNSYDFATFMSFPPRSFVGLLLPCRPQVAAFIIGSPATGRLVNVNWEFAIYVGLITLVLAAFSLTVRKQPALLAAEIALVAAVVLMLGRETPLYPLLYKALPGLRFFRKPAQAIVVATWAISIMCAFGFDRLFSPDGQRWRERRWRGIALTAMAAAGLSVIVLTRLVGAGIGEMRQPEVVSFSRLSLGSWFLGVPMVTLAATFLLVLAMGWLPRRAAAMATLALLAVDLLAARPAFELRTYSPSADRDLKVLKRIGTPQSQPFRVDLAPSAVNANASLAAHVENVNAYWSTGLRRFYRYVHWMHGRAADPLYRHELPDEVYVGDNPFALRVLNVGWATRIDARQGIAHFIRNPRPEPRAWVVERAEVISDEEAILKRMRDPQFDPSTAVILEREPRVAMASVNSPIGTCQPRKHKNGDLDVDTDTSRDGYLVLSEVYYPGWRATVDGRQVAVERADYLITALPLPAGKHHVRYHYGPSSFKLGAACTGLACATGLSLVVFERLRKRRGESR